MIVSGGSKSTDSLFSDKFGAEKYASISVLIYGSYSRKCMSRLEHLRDKLRENGVKLTNLVSDLPDPPDSGLSPDEINYVKSVSSIENQNHDYLVFIFYGDCDLSSVAMEFMYALLKTKPEKIIVGINLDQIDKISTLIMGSTRYHLNRSKVIYFKKQNEILKELFGKIMGS